MHTYIRVSENLVPRLAALCRGRSFQSADEVTAFILSILRSETSYPMTPGRAPLNKDIVEYTGNEDDFASKLSDAIPCIKHWEADKFVRSTYLKVCRGLA